MRDLEKRIALHKAFWNGEPMDQPIVSYRIGDYFFANKFQANLPLLVKDTLVTPDMVDVDAYMDDYERMYQMSEETGQSAFFTVEPNTGIPWMEGMAGCPIRGEEVAFMATEVGDDIEAVGEIALDRQNPWFLKYVEFLDKLVKLSDGRFPVGEPIMRGTTDVLGCMIGQSTMACAVMEEPEQVQRIFGQVAQMLRDVIEEQWRHVPKFYGGYAAGFYHLWAPEKIIWYQEDLSAILSPWHYDQFLKDVSSKICQGYNYSFVHLHPNSFFHLDGILAQPNLKAVQINKDVTGPTVEEMIPVFHRVLNAGKRLIVWGDLTNAEVTMLMEELPHHSLFLNVITPTVDGAKEIQEIVSSKCSS